MESMKNFANNGVIVKIVRNDFSCIYSGLTKLKEIFNKIDQTDFALDLSPHNANKTTYMWTNMFSHFLGSGDLKTFNWKFNMDFVYEQNNSSPNDTVTSWGRF